MRAETHIHPADPGLRRLAAALTVTHANVRRLSRSVARTVVFVVLLLAANLQGRLLHGLGVLSPGAEGAVFMHGWCRRFLRALGIQYTVEGELPGALATCGGFEAVIVNHLSYLDVLILSACRPFVMVAKTELRTWPLLGWLTAQAGTVYVTRGQGPASYPRVNAAMARAYRSGLPVVFFPEGTTTDGSEVLPLRRGLFHSVLRDNAEVRAAALTYTLGECVEPDRTIANDVCWWGDASLVPHLFRLLGLPQISGHIRFGGTVSGEDRFALAQNGHRALTDLYESITESAPAKAPALFP